MSSSKKNNKKKGKKKKEEAARRKQEEEDEAFARALASTEESVAIAEASMERSQVTMPRAKFFNRSSPRELSTDEMRSLMIMADVPFDESDTDVQLMDRAKLAWNILEKNASFAEAQQQPEPPPQIFVPRAASPPSFSREKQLDEMKAKELLDLAESTEGGESSQPFSRERLPFRATEPYRVSDDELERLRPLYTELLSGTCYDRLVDIVSNCDRPRAQWIVLSALDYPFSTYSARKFHHTDKADAPHLVERVFDGFFVLSVVVDRIAKDRKIVSWCRDALRLEIDQSILGLALNILVSCTSGTYKPTKSVRKLILFRRSGDNDFEGDVGPIRELVADLADVFCDESRKLDPNLKLLGLQLPITCIAAIDPTKVDGFDFFGEDVEARDAFSRVLEDDVRPRVEDEFYQVLKSKLFQREPKTSSSFSTNSLADIDDDDRDELKTISNEEEKKKTRSTRDGAWNNVDRNPTRQCDREGCTQIGYRKCAGCALVSYCSKECQLLDWRNGHELTCANNNSQRTKKMTTCGFHDND